MVQDDVVAAHIPERAALPPEAPRAAGRGEIVVALSGGASRVVTARAESPLKLLLPRNHGVAQWIFTATFGGGLVDGDAIAIDVDVRDGAAVLLATQASTKVYKSLRGSWQRLHAHVRENALLAIVPDPVACFRGATYSQETRVHLSDSASLLFVDALTCGRAAHGERWDFDRYASRTAIVRKNKPIVNDATLLDARSAGLSALAARMGRFDAIATAFVFGPRVARLRDAFMAAAEGAAPAKRADAIVAASPIGDDGAMLRVAGTSTALATRALHTALLPLATILGDDPFARKW